MKKFIAFILTITLCLSILCITVNASGPEIQLASAAGKPGEQVTLQLSISGNAGLAYLKLKVGYDSSALTLTGAENAGLLGGIYTTSQTMDVNPFVLQWMAAGNTVGDGVIATLTFDISETAAPGDQTISLSFEECYNEDLDDVVFATVPGTITVQSTGTAVETISLDKDTLSLKTGESETLTATITPEDATNQTVTWHSDNEAVAKVDRDGTVTALKKGTANITVTTEDGDKSASCIVTVECGHANKVEVPSKTPDCFRPGNHLYYTCDSCGLVFKADGVTETTVEAETIPALGHDYQAIVTAPTCTEKGYTTHTCSRCNDSYVDSYVDALGHDYATKVTAPTCTEQGYTTYTCSRCNDSYVDNYVDALGHDYVAVVTLPTCTEQGYTTHTCNRCHDSYIDTYADALGHSYGPDWNKGEDGHWHECTFCGDKKDFATHDYGTDGDKCVLCGYERTHVHRLTLVPATEATCIMDGNKAYYTCSGCEDWFADANGTMAIENHSDVIIQALGHDDTAIVTAPTCTKKGYTTHTCSRCGDSYVDSYVDALGHDYIASVTAPTCTEQGYTTYICSRCGDSYVDRYVDALGHDYDTAWNQGDTRGHWHDCKACGAHTEAEAHVSGPGATEDTPQVCKVCGYVIQPALGHTHHIAPVDGCDATCTEKGQKSHYICEGCGKLFEDAEGNVEITDSDSLVISALGHDWKEEGGVKVCQRCGAEEELPHAHTESGWKADAKEHWKVCEDCSAEIDGSRAAHADENHDCKCDICGCEVAPVEKPNSNKPGDGKTDSEKPDTGDNSMTFLWVVLFVVSCTGIVTVAFHPKKHTGRYLKK